MNVIVSFREIDKAINKNYESVSKRMDEDLKKIEKDRSKAFRMQAAFGAALRDIAEAAAEVDPELMYTPEHRMASLIQTYLGEQAAKYGKCESVPQGGYEIKFAHDDILGWLFGLFDWIQGLWPHKMIHPKNAIPNTFPNSARFAVFGDWGTGLYGAPVIGKTLENDPNPFTMLLHLGDVYYSGTETEINFRFLKYWPQRKDAISRALNSNHEMYSGGHGYFKKTLPTFGQSSSYFAFQNDYWTIIGLDTGYEDHDLDNEQVKWLNEVIGQAQDRKVILSSHHQPYSHISGQGPKLIEKLGNLLNAKKIFAWYWGHEHRCVLYDQHPIYGFYGRCIGHSGMPYARKKVSHIPIAEKDKDIEWRRMEAKNMVPGALFLDGPNRYIKKKEKKYGPNGYITLEFEDEHLNEVLHEPDGTKIYEKQIA
ncbi:MAG: metallophosphoesterase family protein [bacterium]